MPKIEIPFLDLSREQRIDPNKIPKVKLVEILSRNLSTKQIYRELIRLGKHKLAEDFSKRSRIDKQEIREITSRNKRKEGRRHRRKDLRLNRRRNNLPHEETLFSHIQT